MWCEIRRQAVKKKEYEKCIEKVDNEKMKEALIQAFDKDFPRIIELCDDDYTVVQIFVSLFEMLGEVQKVGMENVSFEKYVIGKAFPDYLKLLVGWVEINFENQWYELEAFILDKTYIKKLQEQNSECTGAFCGYGVAVKDFRNLIIEFDRNNTYIQSEGINQDFGVYDCPDELLKEHHQEISAFKAFAYRHIARHLMNRNVRKIRER